MNFRRSAVLPVVGFVVTTAAWAAEPEAIQTYGLPDAASEIVVRSTTDVGLFEPVLLAFIDRYPQTAILYEQWASNDLYVISQMACQRGTDAADLIISSSVDQQVKLVNDGCAQPHRSAVTDAQPTSTWRNEIFGITLEPAVIVYNKDFVSEAEAPKSRFDIIDLLRPADSRFAGRVATYDIQESGLGYLFAFMDSLQATTFGSMIEAFARSGAVETCCSAEIIDGVIDGRYLLAYNVLGSYALARAETAPNLVVVAPTDYTLLLRRAALIPKDARDPTTAGLFLDFLLSPEGQRLLAAQHLVVDPSEAGTGGLHVPVETQAAVRQIPLSPVLLVGLDQQKRAAFLELWRTTFRKE